jgi:glycosyltransferase involved in cell wall biosynthesis
MGNSRERMAYIASSYAAQHDGISVYLENLLYEISLLDCIAIDVYIKKSVKEKLISRIDKNGNLKDINFISLPDKFILHIILLNYYINIKRYVLVFSPSLTPVLSIRNRSMKVIHDVTYKVFSKSLSFLKRSYKSLLFWLLNFDDYYGYISKPTLEQINIFTTLHRHNKPFILLSNGIPLQTKLFFESLNSDSMQHKKNKNIELLFVGSLNYHKGLDKALEFASLMSSRVTKPVVLRLVGKETLDTKGIMQKYIDNSDFKLDIKGYVSDSELYELYAQSKYILFFSHSEGFGLPVVEAGYFNTFPILSDLPVFKQLTNNALFYYSYERDNLDEIVDNIVNLEEDGKNQYFSVIESMCDKYKKEYSNSAKRICELIKF